MSPENKTHRPLPWEDQKELVTFTTPEQIEVSYRVASLGTRLIAVLVDVAVIHVFIAAITIGGLVFGFSLTADPELLSYILAGYLILLFILKCLYFAWAELHYEGRTIGKRLFRIRSVMVSGHGITFGAAMVRNLARIVDHIPLAWIVPVITRGHRRIGDLLAGTVVIDEETRDSKLTQVTRASSYRELENKFFHFTAESESRLVPDDLNLVEHLFHRASAIGDDRSRKNLFLSVAQKYIERLKLYEQQVEVEQKPRRFLEELYLFMRDRFDAESL